MLYLERGSKVVERAIQQEKLLREYEYDIVDSLVNHCISIDQDHDKVVLQSKEMFRGFISSLFNLNRGLKPGAVKFEMVKQLCEKFIFQDGLSTKLEYHPSRELNNPSSWGFNQEQIFDLILDTINTVYDNTYRALRYYAYFLAAKPIEEVYWWSNEDNTCVGWKKTTRQELVNGTIGLYLTNLDLSGYGRGVFIPDLNKILESEEFKNYSNSKNLKEDFWTFMATHEEYEFEEEDKFIKYLADNFLKRVKLGNSNPEKPVNPIEALRQKADK